jgi:hypothetical protein
LLIIASPWSRKRALKTRLAALIACLPLALAACTSTALQAARTDMAAGHYNRAHADLAAALKGDLSASQRREAQDDLCWIEFQTGAPAYSLRRQRAICAVAADQAGSKSGIVLAKVDDLIRQKQAAAMKRALASRDLAGAIAVALAYRDIEPQDTALSEQWNRQIWALAASEEHTGETGRHARLSRTLALLSVRYAGERRMDRQRFEQWLRGAAWEPDAAPAATIAIHEHQLRLTLRGDETAALDAQNLGRINDAFMVWCHCDGTTYAVDDRTGLPISIVRMNPMLMRSEVIDMPHTQSVAGEARDLPGHASRGDESPPRESQSRTSPHTG